MVENVINVNYVDWDLSDVLIYHIRRIEESKLILEEDFNSIKQIKSRYKETVDKKPHWLIVACCSASMGVAASVTLDSIWPLLISLTPSAYGIYNFCLMAIQKKRIDDLIHCLCIIQTSTFATLEQMCNSTIIDSSQGLKLFWNAPFTSEIEWLIENLYDIMKHINDNIVAVENMNDILSPPCGTDMVANINVDTRVVFNKLRNLNNYYIKIISKLLSTMDICLTAKLHNLKSRGLHNLTSLGVDCMFSKIIPGFLNVVEKRAVDIKESYYSLQMTPFDDYMLCVDKPLEWYLTHLDAFVENSYALKEINGTQKFLREISQDLRDARCFVSSYFQKPIEHFPKRKEIEREENFSTVTERTDDTDDGSEFLSNDNISITELTHVEAPHKVRKTNSKKAEKLHSQNTQKLHKSRNTESEDIRLGKGTKTSSGKEQEWISEKPPLRCFTNSLTTITEISKRDRITECFSPDDSNDSFESIIGDNEGRDAPILCKGKRKYKDDAEHLKTTTSSGSINSFNVDEGTEPKQNFIKYGFMLAARTLARFRNEENLYYKD